MNTDDELDKGVFNQEQEQEDMKKLGFCEGYKCGNICEDNDDQTKNTPMAEFSCFNAGFCIIADDL